MSRITLSQDWDRISRTSVSGDVTFADLGALPSLMHSVKLFNIIQQKQSIKSVKCIQASSLCLSEAQPVYIGVPAAHRRKRRRHHSCAGDADRDSRHTHYDHHVHREHRGYYHDREEHYDDEDGGAAHHEYIDPAGEKLPVSGVWRKHFMNIYVEKKFKISASSIIKTQIIVRRFNIVGFYGNRHSWVR